MNIDGKKPGVKIPGFLKTLTATLLLPRLSPYNPKPRKGSTLVNAMNQYFIPIVVAGCGLTLFLSLSLYSFINRGSGRTVATATTTETKDESPKRGDDRRLIDWGKERNRRITRTNRYGRN